MSAALKIKALSALVRVKDLDEHGKARQRSTGIFTADGKPELEPLTRVVLLSRGEELPKHLVEGELARLKELNVVGTDEDLVNVETVAAPAAEPPPEPKKKVEVDLTKLAELSDAELAEALPTVGAKKLVEAIGTDVGLAKRVLEAEAVATKGSPRSTLVKPLNKLVTAADAGSTS
jgi:hypothetical protein